MSITQLKINNTDVFLEDYSIGNGKITISDTSGHNYSYHWGAMGSDIKSFLLSISSDYFANKLVPVCSQNVIDVKQTFKNLRFFIKAEFDLPFYKEMKFQKDMREKIKTFQNECHQEGGKYFFVQNFELDFTDNLDFNLIENSFDKQDIQRSFKSLDEPWHFLIEKPSEEYEWLYKFHSKLKKELKP